MVDIYDVLKMKKPMMTLKDQSNVNFNRAADKLTEAEALSKATSDFISGGSGVIKKRKKLYTSDPRLEAKKLLEIAEAAGEFGELQSKIKQTKKSKLLAAAQKERNTENELEKVVAKKKLGKVGKKEDSKVDWADAGQKVAAGLISAAQERERAKLAQDKINRSVLRDQLDLSNAASARKGQALSGLRTALANYFR